MDITDYKKEKLANILQLSKSGDIKALEELIRRIQKDIYVMFSYLTDKKQDISDLTQEVLLKVARNIYTLKENKNFKSWVNHIVSNTFYDYIRAISTENKIDSDNEKLLDIKDKAGCEPGERCLYSEMEKIIKAAILDLPHNLRVAIVLREYEGLSYEEISKATNSTLGSVKSRISRARTKLQQQLKEFI